jgi:hypothetical protein
MDKRAAYVPSVAEVKTLSPTDTEIAAEVSEGKNIRIA